MKLPKSIDNLIKAQNSYDSAAYSDCFSDTAVVLDEGKTYNGKAEIARWNTETNKQYKTVIRPVSVIETDKISILTTEISGNFDGSPVTFQYLFKINNELIESLEIGI